MLVRPYAGINIDIVSVFMNHITWNVYPSQFSDPNDPNKAHEASHNKISRHYGLRDTPDLHIIKPSITFPMDNQNVRDF